MAAGGVGVGVDASGVAVGVGVAGGGVGVGEAGGGVGDGVVLSGGWVGVGVGRFTLLPPSITSILAGFEAVIRGLVVSVAVAMIILSADVITAK